MRAVLHLKTIEADTLGSVAIEPSASAIRRSGRRKQGFEPSRTGFQQAIGEADPADYFGVSPAEDCSGCSDEFAEGCEEALVLRPRPVGDAQMPGAAEWRAGPDGHTRLRQ